MTPRNSLRAMLRLGLASLVLSACSPGLVSQGPVQMPVPVPKRPQNAPRPLPPLDPPPQAAPAPAAPKPPAVQATPRTTTEEAPGTPQAETVPSEPSMEILNGVLWMQTSVEYRAATLQTYRMARERLEEALGDPQWQALAAPPPALLPPAPLPPAVILDVDETVLDNTPFEARLIADGESFDKEKFFRWCREEKATAVAGALEFTRFAAASGVAVFYVTNRDHEVEGSTARNLANLGFPDVGKEGQDHLLTRYERPEWQSDKSGRWREIAASHRVLLLIGDDLGDFVGAARTSPEAREQILLEHAQRWGRQWIILPNPLYGSWERALFFTADSPTPVEQRDIKIRGLKTRR